MFTPEKARPKNRLLTKLPEPQLAAVMATAELIEMKIFDGIIEAQADIEHAYFPESGVISLVTPLKDGSAVEATTVGNEGMVGLPLILGAPQTLTKAFCQVPGYAWRLRADDFRQYLKNDPLFGITMLRYTQTVIDLIAQTSACNRLHTIEQRCSRWLLLVHDRSEGDSFQLTQESLAQMLGVQRTGVNIAAGALQKANLIAYARGKITICNRAGLENLACECYSVVRNAISRFDALDVCELATRGGEGFKK